MAFNWKNLEPAHILSWMHDNAPHLVEPLMQHLSGFAGDVLGNTPGSINGINHGTPLQLPPGLQQRNGMQNQLQNNPYLNRPGMPQVPGNNPATLQRATQYYDNPTSSQFLNVDPAQFGYPPDNTARPGINPFR